MFNVKKLKSKHICCEDISLIENYQQAISDKKHRYVCHHRLEIHEDYHNTAEELEMMGLYHNRPACELIFLTIGEHTTLHQSCETWNKENGEKISKALKGKQKSEEHKRNMSKARLGKPIGPHSEETKRKISESRKGVPLSDKHRQSLKVAWKHRTAKPYSPFGEKFFKQFGYGQKQNMKQYKREWAYYKKHGKCSWG